MNNPGKLYLVPTPIGNLGDMTFRAVDVLKNAGFILAEDTRVSNTLLTHYRIRAKVIAHHKFNEHKTVDSVVEKLSTGEAAAMITDAGTPGISDPGYLIVKKCIEAGIEVECLPGATALIPALAVSGLPSDRFVFEGFLPHKKGRQKRLQALEREVRTMVFYESPFRLLKTLEQLGAILGNSRLCCVCRELSKIHEEIFRGSISDVYGHFSKKNIKGEIVLIVAGADKKELKDNGIIP